MKNGPQTNKNYKNPSAKKLSLAPRKPTHLRMNSELKDIGRQLPKMSLNASRSDVPNINNIPNISLKNININRSVLQSANWGRYYRSIQSGQDELVSTSSVRELIDGILNTKGGLSEDKKKALDNFFNDISRVRFPTEWTGFARDMPVNGARTMQHPTSSGGGIWINQAGTGAQNSHAELDRQRKEAILDVLKNELSKKSNLNVIKKEIIMRAISFTLNEFTAPATARDQRPNNSIKSKELVAQVRAREQLKEIFVRLGGVQEQSTNMKMVRNWGDRRGLRSVSPPRTQSSNSIASTWAGAGKRTSLASSGSSLNSVNVKKTRLGST